MLSIKTNTVYKTKTKQYVLTGSDVKNGFIEIYALVDKDEFFWRLKPDNTLHVFNVETREYIGSTADTPRYKQCSELVEEIISYKQFPAKMAIPKPETFTGVNERKSKIR